MVKIILIGSGSHANACIDVIENNEVRVALPKVSDWPTFPQVFINGELVGGADIIAQMHESGELKKLIDSAQS